MPLTGAPDTALFADEVYRLAVPGSAVRNVVPLFQDRGLADLYASEVAAHRTQVRVSAPPGRHA